MFQAQKMRFFSGFFLSVLFCNIILSAVAATDDNGELIDGNFPMDIQNGNNRRKLKLTDLNDDVLFHIFEQVWTDDFWSLFETHPRFKFILQALFRSKFNRIEIKNAHSNNIECKYFTDPFENRLTLFDLDLILKTIENFGVAMRRIYVDNFSIDQFSSMPNSEKSNRIFQFINKYASETLECFDLGRLKENTLQQFTVPFAKVEEVNTPKACLIILKLP